MKIKDFVRGFIRYSLYPWLTSEFIFHDKLSLLQIGTAILDLCTTVIAIKEHNYFKAIIFFILAIVLFSIAFIRYLRSDEYFKILNDKLDEICKLIEEELKKGEE